METIEVLFAFAVILIVVIFLRYYIYSCEKVEGFGRGRGGGGRGGGGRGGGGRGGGGRGGVGPVVGPTHRVAHHPSRRGRWGRNYYYSSPYAVDPWWYYRYNYPDWYDYGTGPTTSYNSYKIRRNYAPEFHDSSNESTNEDIVEVMNTCRTSSSARCNVIVNDRKNDKRFRYSMSVDWDDLVPMEGVDTYIRT
jgi:hypothetical protein